VFVLVMIYVYMITIMVIMQLLLKLVMLEVMGDEFECDQMSRNFKSMNLT